jgi:predicted phosphodiesterase
MDMRKACLAALAAAALCVILSHSFVFQATPAAAQAQPQVTRIRPRNAGTIAPTPRLFGSPYITDVTSTSVTLNWVVKTTAVATGWRVEHVPLNNLTPGATYYYDVFRDGTREGRGQFTMPPDAKSPDNFTFVVYGDTRSRDDVHRQIISKVVVDRPAFVVHTGDLVTDGRTAALWPNFFIITDPLMRRAVFFPMLGNHERNTPYFREFFPTAPDYYSFTWGNVHVAVVNSDFQNAAATNEAREIYRQKELDWLERDLAGAASADFRFVAMHHPLITAMKTRQAETERRAGWFLPTLKKGNVQVVFAGHDHNYQHHRSEGIDFITTGGGGAPLYDLDAPVPGVTLKTEKIENYVRVRIKGRECLMQGVALDGHLIDTVNITAPKTASR